MKHIPSEELTPDLVPDPDAATEAELWDFAHTFSAYTRWGGLREAHEVAELAGNWQALWLEEHGEPEDGFYPFPEPQLDHLRSSMFLDCRAERHCNQDGPPEESFWTGLREGVRAVRHFLEAA